jgi:hypothetical protein
VGIIIGRGRVRVVLGVGASTRIGRKKREIRYVQVQLHEGESEGGLCVAGWINVTDPGIKVGWGKEK